MRDYQIVKFHESEIGGGDVDSFSDSNFKLGYRLTYTCDFRCRKDEDNLSWKKESMRACPHLYFFFQDSHVLKLM